YLGVPRHDRLDLAHEACVRRAHGQADVDLKPAVAWQHVDLDAARNDPGRNRETVEDAAAACPECALDGGHRGGDRPPAVSRLCDGQPVEPVEVLDQVACDLNGVL